MQHSERAVFAPGRTSLSLSNCYQQYYISMICHSRSCMQEPRVVDFIGAEEKREVQVSRVQVHKLLWCEIDRHYSTCGSIVDTSIRYLLRISVASMRHVAGEPWYFESLAGSVRNHVIALMPGCFVLVSAPINSPNSGCQIIMLNTPCSRSASANTYIRLLSIPAGFFYAERIDSGPQQS